VLTSTSSSPLKNPVAGSYETGGALDSSTSWLEFFGPGKVPVEEEVVVEVVLVLVVLVEPEELLVVVVELEPEEVVEEVVDEVIGCVVVGNVA